MPIFSNPVVLNNGADHTFIFRSQIYDSSSKKAIIGEWIEQAAPIADESKITVKHDSSSATVRRRLVQRKVNRTTPTRGMRPITVNVTVAYDVEHTDAFVEAEIALVKDMFAEATFAANLLDGLI